MFCMHGGTGGVETIIVFKLCSFGVTRTGQLCKIRNGILCANGNSVKEISTILLASSR